MSGFKMFDNLPPGVTNHMLEGGYHAEAWDAYWEETERPQEVLDAAVGAGIVPLVAAADGDVWDWYEGHCGLKQLIDEDFESWLAESEQVYQEQFDRDQPWKPEEGAE